MHSNLVWKNVEDSASVCMCITLALGEKPDGLNKMYGLKIFAWLH